jgi:formamidopyrimidine-DNA glycosylase
MPELPEVEVVRKGLQPLLQGRKVEQVHLFREGLRYPFPDLTRLEGHRIVAVTRRSKYLLIELLGAGVSQYVVWHLGMTGQFHVLPQAIKAGSHEHVRIDLDDGYSLRYRDARRFGYVGLMLKDAWQKHPWHQSLGVEPLHKAFNTDVLLQYCAGRKAPIKSIIMHAQTVVGVGNIYASESLFLAGIHPARAAGKISKQRLALLVDAIKQTLQAAIKAGGSSISDFVQVDGKPGYFAHNFNVYGRDGEPCLRCDGKITRIVQSGRSTFYCKGCQH